MTLPLNPVHVWREPITSAARFSLAVLQLYAANSYRIVDAPAVADAGFETSGGLTSIVPGSTAPLRILHFASGLTRIGT